ncbi:nicotinate-nucleotide adenylyltransferase [Gimesia maris]|jgi:nicotinate-nucleotide adenylyltransferase|uniref:Probable nicotinate-nucleotide adenylyltransferase n=1 Tax=Gimesia maris TaxID=122 RepID=A0A3D3RI86_9PLAN|nr:nicotinate-nucleotide adenylyltransferase [Gimesia maris]MAC51048.1 nicotinate-nucleotide adenylyltransferase [Gimesia sp.]EDL61861.1 nicotinate nucleotide adenylyltransferase [Gimesia maris DSM 8797]QEG18578.1 Nicotinate-nucleotide adenylyltransferase [Gimesia maris]QGQ28467.1 nicotinate-nucleotide adenylyltransferase [Gimesia maris]HCO27802.1 nicotinate-nucleotide adenylyltransferase [Gimesia maris]|tara:strand:- start:42 stop:644 length:603 start_codon:yes stop_codon:yes gene_type:complete
MRIGILGGTFDPVHNAHLLMAEQCREQCELDQIWFIPAGNPPHKEGKNVTSGKQRREMLDFAIAGHPAFLIKDLELHREGPSYTVVTLQELQALHPQDEFFLIIGADSVRDLHTWREPEAILELASLIGVNRPNISLPDLTELKQKFGAAIDRKIFWVTMPGIEISSTDLRQRIHENRSVRYMTPRSVEVYIHNNRLYLE